MKRNYFSEPRPNSAKNPVALGFTISFAVAYVVAFAMGPWKLFDLIGFRGTAENPVGFITFPWAYTGVSNNAFFDLLEIVWFYFTATRVEFELGRSRLLALFFGFTLMSSLCMLVVNGLLGEPFLVSSALFVVWAARNQNLPLSFWSIPLLAKWLALVISVLTFFYFAGSSAGALIGLAALVPLAFAWAFGAGLIPGLRLTTESQSVSRRETKKEKQKFTNYIDNIRDREKKREEDERLRRLFESSLSDDPEDKSPR